MSAFFTFMLVVSVRILSALKWRQNADKTRGACFKCGQNADIVIHDA